MSLGPTRQGDRDLNSGTDRRAETVAVIDVGKSNAKLTLADAEGENTPQNDLVAFAQELAATNGVKHFGAAWCIVFRIKIQNNMLVIPEIRQFNTIFALVRGLEIRC